MSETQFRMSEVGTAESAGERVSAPGTERTSTSSPSTSSGMPPGGLHGDLDAWRRREPPFAGEVHPPEVAAFVEEVVSEGPAGVEHVGLAQLTQGGGNGQTSTPHDAFFEQFARKTDVEVRSNPYLLSTGV